MSYADGGVLKAQLSQSLLYYIDLICELEKIGDFIINISEAAMQSK